jgi:hypothetical protein
LAAPSFHIGEKVRLRFTGELGTVLADLGGGLLEVCLDSDPDMQIPTHEDDLQHPSEPLAIPHHPFNKKTPTAPAMSPPPRRVIRGKAPVSHPIGLQMCFEPMPAPDGSIARFMAWLLNDTPYDFLVEVGLYAGDETIFYLEDFAPSCTATELGAMLLDHLNEHPEVDINVQRMTTAGTDEPIARCIRIKPSVFFNRLQHVPILQMAVYQWVLMDRFDPEKTSPTESLRQYTLQRAGKRPTPRQPPPAQRVFAMDEFASFVPEIDLHIEKLTDGWQRIPSADILHIQLTQLQRFLDKAIRLAVPKVYIIHGVGEGKLKDAVAGLLHKNPHVKRFQNQYHKRYGYGATEAWL